MNEPEKPEPKTGKQIVSKGEYAVNVVLKGMAYSASVGLFLLNIVCFGMVLLGLWLISGGGSDRGWRLIGFLFTILFTYATIVLFPISRRALQETNCINPGVPLTRANTGDLPAPESLVRASEQPIQAQKAVLLWVAQGAADTREEQLLKASQAREE